MSYRNDKAHRRAIARFRDAADYRIGLYISQRDDLPVITPEQKAAQAAKAARLDSIEAGRTQRHNRAANRAALRAHRERLTMAYQSADTPADWQHADDQPSDWQTTWLYWTLLLEARQPSLQVARRYASMLYQRWLRRGKPHLDHLDAQMRAALLYVRQQEDSQPPDRPHDA